MLSLGARTKLYEELELSEEFRRFPYRCSQGFLTIGIGRNIDERGISYDEAKYLLQNDVKRCGDEIMKKVPWVIDLDETRKIVVLSMWYNLGQTKFLEFVKFWDALKKHDFELAAKEMQDSLWFRQVKHRAVKYVQWMQTGKMA